MYIITSFPVVFNIPASYIKDILQKRLKSPLVSGQSVFAVWKIINLSHFYPIFHSDSPQIYLHSKAYYLHYRFLSAPTQFSSIRLIYFIHLRLISFQVASQIISILSSILIIPRRSRLP